MQCPVVVCITYIDNINFASMAMVFSKGTLYMLIWSLEPLDAGFPLY
jgi:hypothetical protein